MSGLTVVWLFSISPPLPQLFRQDHLVPFSSSPVGVRVEGIVAKLSDNQHLTTSPGVFQMLKPRRQQ